MDDQRFGAVLRSIRVKGRLRQVDLAAKVGVSDALISRPERGHLDEVTVATIRSVARQLDIRVDLAARWRASDLDPLLNAKHSELHELVARHVAQLPDWVAQPEVSFAVYGARGIIDILAWHPVDGRCSSSSERGLAEAERQLGGSRGRHDRPREREARH